MGDDKQECGPQCGKGLGCGHGCTWPQIAESIRDWAMANGVNWDQHTVMWPEIWIADDDKTFQIEQFQHDKHERLELIRGLGGTILTTMKTYEQRVLIDPELIVAYRFSRSKAMKSAKWEALERFLQWHPPAVSLKGGETLIFITRDRMEHEVCNEAKRVLQEALPGVNVVLISGVDTVMAGPGPISL